MTKKCPKNLAKRKSVLEESQKTREKKNNDDDDEKNVTRSTNKEILRTLVSIKRFLVSLLGTILTPTVNLTINSTW